jgi:hypothetical protein
MTYRLHSPILSHGSTGDALIASLGSVAYFRHNSGITVTGAGVSQWDDATGLGHHLLQGTDSARPAKQSDGSILFNGTSHFLKTAAFTLNQPTTVVIVFKQVSWTSNDFVYDGEGLNVGALAQLNAGASPQLVVNAGGASAANSNLAVGSVGVAYAVYNGASGVFGINRTAELTGNYGSANMGGFAIGKRGDATASNYSNIQVYEAALFPSALSAADRARLAAYMMDKFAIA